MAEDKTGNGAKDPAKDLKAKEQIEKIERTGTGDEGGEVAKALDRKFGKRPKKDK